MIELLSDPAIWISLLTLTILEIVLGIDNIIFISIVASRLPPEQQARARYIGLSLALIMRIILLSMIAWLASLTQSVFTLFGEEFSWRDIILIGGGLFLLVKGTSEIHHHVEGGEANDSMAKKATFAAVIGMIVVLDIVFSLDSVITAIGMSDQLFVMITAVVIAMGVMLFAAKPVSDFVNMHPTVKMLALSFLLLIGMALVADGMGFHIPKGYLYFAVAFSLGVECLNIWMRKKRQASL
ncbi:MAG: TerC family protein [Alphaproteobacteria bacterium]|nr:TerC family protein [Alphaproteobacteria bacterium]